MCDEKLFSRIELNIFPSSGIESCILAAKRLAKDYECTVSFKFNGVRIYITKDTDLSLEQLLDFYNTKLMFNNLKNR